MPADLAQGMQVPAGQAPGVTMHVPTGQAPGANLQVPTTTQAPGVQVPAGSARYAIRMGSGSVYTYPPPVTQPNPWAQDIHAKLVIRSAGPVPSPG